MSLSLQEIINEADVLVPNAYSNGDKVNWINILNQQFFEVVKIPRLYTFNTVGGQAQYTLYNQIRSNNIDKVHVGNVIYRSFGLEDVQPTQNFFTYDDNNFTLALFPPPYGVLFAKVRYYQMATTSFISGNLTVPPDAPPEYHWTYVIGLCSYIAKAMDDISKANNYMSDYQAALNIAAQNYRPLGVDGG